MLVSMTTLFTLHIISTHRLLAVVQQSQGEQDLMRKYRRALDVEVCITRVVTGSMMNVHTLLHQPRLCQEGVCALVTRTGDKR